MANSTTNIDVLSASQANKEITANAVFDAVSQGALFGRRASTTSGLTWGFYGGRILVDGVLTTISNGTVALTGSATNYVEATRAGVVSRNTTGFTAGSIPLYTITTLSTSVSTYTDERAVAKQHYITQNVTFAVTGADVTLTAAQARGRYLAVTGTLTGNRNVVTPNNGEWIVFNNTAGAFTLTIKTSAGTGVTIAQGTRAIVYADGTNVVRITADA